MQYFSFWDIDSTLLKSAEHIKNPHLTLPILLFQSRAKGHHVGILTNRGPNDDAAFTIKQLLEELRQFGVEIPSSHIIIAGGVNATPSVEDWYALNEAIKNTGPMEAITKNLAALELTEKGQELASRTQEKKTWQELLNVRFDGKNYFFVNFFNARYKDASYHFESGVCPKDELQLGMIDDLENISQAANTLGKPCFGIKASRGGNPPEFLSQRDPDDDYYEDMYLFALSMRTGLDAYAKDLLQNPGSHLEEDPIVRLSALLYAWHRFYTTCHTSHFQSAIKRLNELQCEQFLEMLKYIEKYANEHKDAHYRPVEKLILIFQARKDFLFLETAYDKYQSLQKTYLPSGTFDRLRKALSYKEAKETLFEQQLQELFVRINRLRRSSDLELRGKAEDVLQTINSSPDRSTETSVYTKRRPKIGSAIK